MLDLCLTNVDSLTVKVRPKLADHVVLVASLRMTMPSASVAEREVFDFSRADWDGLRDCLLETDRSVLDTLDVGEAAEFVTN